MKTIRIITTVRAVLWLCAITTGFAQGSAFTYQGRLDNGGAPANGLYDLRFTLHDSLTGGTALATNTTPGTAVTNGLFTATLDFGAAVFDGTARWLEMAVRTNGAAVFTTLNPRQSIAATPYAIRSANAASAVSVSGPVSAGQLTGTISSNNIGAGSISIGMLAPGAVGSSQLAPGAVTMNALADGAVTGTKIAKATVLPPPITFTHPVPAAEDNFGESVAALGIDRVLIGAPYDDTGTANAGTVYLFNTSGALLTTFTNPAPAAGYYFGLSVAALGADHVIIGSLDYAPGAMFSGAAYLFSTNGALLTTFTNPTPAPNDQFGRAVTAVGNDRILVGASGDGAVATNAGTAYLFSTNGALLTTFANPRPASSIGFGNCVTVVGTDRVLIGGPGGLPPFGGAGAAYLFSTNGALLTTFTHPGQPPPFPQFGYSVAALGTDRVLIGAYGYTAGPTVSQVVHLFRTDGTLLTTFTHPTQPAGNGFGRSVAAVGADRVLIGADSDGAGVPGTGVAFLFSTNGALLLTLTNPSPAADDRFGRSVAAVGTGGVLIGAWADDTVATNAGAAYFYSLDTTTYMPGLVAESVRDGSVTSSSIAPGAVRASHIEATTWQLATNVNGGTAAMASNVVAGIAITNALITNSVFAGDGAGLTNVNATALVGAIPTAALASVPAGNLSGTVPLAALPAGLVTNGAGGVVLSGVFSGDGAGLTNLNGTGSGGLTNCATGVTLTGTFAGDGSGLTNLNGGNIAAGTIGAAQLAAGAVSSNHLAPGAAAGNLNAGGQAPVPAGGLILAASDNSASLTAAGYTRLGSTTLDPSWVQRATNAPQSGYYGATAVWSGSEMLIWGGYSGANTYPNLGARYNPAANTWISMSTNSTLAGRQNHTMIWAGNQAIVWGGGQFLGPTTWYRDGGRYEPATDTWIPVASSGAPTNRSDHSAVWTGTEMIIWGGSTGAAVFGDGGRYNPLSNAWTALKTASAPLARDSHTAVWTGTEMIVWGGYGGGAYRNDGGRYNPATDTWTSTTTNGAPTRRQGHVAVWTGTEMLIWGGYYYVGATPYYPSDGGAYSPLTDTWTPLATNNAPIPRGLPMAVWTGSEVVVWGGARGSSMYGDGAAYSPAKRSWTPISTSTSPVARCASATLWTGSEMVIWGGSSGTAYLTDTWSLTPGRVLWLYLKP